jgi:GNAT superfamily N-acetyltransferase
MGERLEPPARSGRDKQGRHIVERSPTAVSGCVPPYGIRRASNGEASRVAPLTHDATDFPADLRISFDAAPSVETRAALGHEINAYHARTVPEDGRALCSAAARREQPDGGGAERRSGLAVAVRRGLWVRDAWRGHGIGRTLLTQAEAHAVAVWCHSAWLDTFRARGFYLTLGYQQFGALDDYPQGQTRYFPCKQLVAAMEAGSASTTR